MWVGCAFSIRTLLARRCREGPRVASSGLCVWSCLEPSFPPSSLPSVREAPQPCFCVRQQGAAAFDSGTEISLDPPATGTRKKNVFGRSPAFSHRNLEPSVVALKTWEFQMRSHLPLEESMGGRHTESCCQKAAWVEMLQWTFRSVPKRKGSGQGWRQQSPLSGHHQQEDPGAHPKPPPFRVAAGQKTRP